MRFNPFPWRRNPFAGARFTIDPPAPIINNVTVLPYSGNPPEPRVSYVLTRPAGWHEGTYGPAEYDVEIAIEVFLCE